MGIINISLPSDGTPADVADVNSPLTTIQNVINGNLDANNLASNAVTTAKIANDAVTTVKIPNDAITATKIDWASTGVDAGIWWEELGRTTLTPAGDTITVSFPARAYLKIQFKGLDTGGTIGASLRFNSDTANNYSLRFSTNGAADTTATAQNNIGFGLGNGADPFYGEIFVVNHATEDKLAMGFVVRSNATGAATTPSKTEGTGKWSNVVDQITSVSLVNISGTGDYAVGSEVIVLGHN